MKFTKRTIAGAIAGTVLAGTAAYAAIALYSSAHVSAAASTASPLTVDNVQFATTLLPGGSADVKGDVHNTNSFPVTVTDVIVKSAGAHGVGADCGPGILTVGGTFGPNWTIGDGAGATAAGNKFTLAPPITIPASTGTTITVPNAVLQAAGSHSFCGFEADLVVVASAGN